MKCLLSLLYIWKVLCSKPSLTELGTSEQHNEKAQNCTMRRRVAYSVDEVSLSIRKSHSCGIQFSRLPRSRRDREQDFTTAKKLYMQLQTDRRGRLSSLLIAGRTASCWVMGLINQRAHYCFFPLPLSPPPGSLFFPSNKL
jgi:hypothetical protein